MMNVTNNTLFYRFKSEKKSYPISFETTEISIGDIKKLITKRRGLEKCPESCELLIFDDKTNEEYKNDNKKINPLKTLIIQRIPSYLLNPQFTPILRNENQIRRKTEQQQVLNNLNSNVIISNSEDIQPQVVEKAQEDNAMLISLKEKFTSKHIEKLFNCSQCNKTPYINPVVTDCCGETYCKSCLSSKINCPNCYESNLKYTPNLKMKELQEKIIKIFEEQKNNGKIEGNSIMNNNESGNKSVNHQQIGGLFNISSISNQNNTLKQFSGISSNEVKSYPQQTTVKSMTEEQLTHNNSKILHYNHYNRYELSYK